MKQLKTHQEKIEWYSVLHKQNLNGRETEDELFELGISAGIEETEELQDEFAIGFAHFLAEHTYSCYENGWSNDFGHKDLTTKELLEIYKKEK
jgi:hypothetical protein